MTTPIRIGAAEPEETPDNSDHFEIPGQASEATIDPATVLADIASEMSATVEDAQISRVVPVKPHFMLSYRTQIDYDTLRMWIRKAKVQKEKDTTHMLRLAFAVLSNTNTGITFKGVEAPASDGRPLCISHPEFLTMVKAPIGNSVPAAIRKFWGGYDGHIIQTMNDILEAAGYGEVDLEGSDNDGPLTY